MAAALSGALIIRQNEKEFVYCGKCDKCGKAKQNLTTTKKQLSPKSKMSAGSYKCDSCGHTSKQEFMG